MALSLPTIPIGIFAHDRPDHLQRTLHALRRSPEFPSCPLTIFCDAPRTDEVIPRVAEVRRVAHEWVAEEGGRVIEREENWGFCNLVEGVSQLCAEFGATIVVEDDLYPAPDFLTYLRAGLWRYWEEERVMSINASMFEGAHPLHPTTFFLSTALATGWGTWQRAWRHFSWQPKNLLSFLSDEPKRNEFDFKGKWRISDWLEKAMRGELACWDPQWAFTIFDQGGLTLFPSRSLLWNTGLGCGMAYDGERVPTFEGRERSFFGELEERDFDFPRLPAGWNYPERVEADRQAYKRMTSHFQRERRASRRALRGPFWRRQLRSLGKRFLPIFSQEEVNAS